MAEKSNKVLLQVKGLKVAYGGIQAVKGVDFEVREGELVSLIGSNGAGKTTTMKAITGTLPINDGDIEYLGESIKGKGAWDLVKKGLVMVPEGRGVFARMTITENLQMGAYIAQATRRASWPTSKRCSPSSRACANARTSWPAPCRVVNSKCWPWAAR
jgi:branched-chain amino acid transport system ATP-binding protein